MDNYFVHGNLIVECFKRIDDFNNKIIISVQESDQVLLLNDMKRLNDYLTNAIKMMEKETKDNE